MPKPKPKVVVGPSKSAIIDDLGFDYNNNKPPPKNRYCFTTIAKPKSEIVYSAEDIIELKKTIRREPKG